MGVGPPVDWAAEPARPRGSPIPSSKAVMRLFLDILLVITSVALMALILLHRGKGGGLSSLFGGSMQSSLSGSSVVEKNLDRLTLFVALVWTVSIVGVGLLLKVGA
jgi:preprotein translocase subunit SecG